MNKRKHHSMLHLCTWFAPPASSDSLWSMVGSAVRILVNRTPNCVKNIQNIPKTTESIWVPLGCFLMLESIGICSKMFKYGQLSQPVPVRPPEAGRDHCGAARLHPVPGRFGRPAAPGALPGAASLATWGARRRSAWWKLATKPGAVKIS